MCVHRDSEKQRSIAGWPDYTTVRPRLVLGFPFSYSAAFFLFQPTAIAPFVRWLLINLLVLFTYYPMGSRARGSCGLCGLHYSLLGKLPSLFQRYVCLFSYLACGFVMRLGRGLFLSVHSLFPQCFLTILTVGMERMIRGCVYALRIGACGDHCV